MVDADIKGGHLMDIQAIVQALTLRIDELCTELLPGGRRAGPEWEIGSLQGEPGRSLKVHLTGARAGVWRDFSAGIGGDALDLVARVLCNGDKAAALRWSRRWLGIDAMPPEELARQRAQLKARAEAAAKQQEQNNEDVRERAFRLWMAGSPISGSPAETYLAGRGIPLGLLANPPGSLRFVPSLWNGESKSNWPGMVACINRPGEKKMVAVHRTWLQVRGDGSVVKAPLDEAKKSWGSFKGGFIPLSRGASNKTIADAPQGDIAAISEGIEDGLTVALAKPEYRVLCAVSLGNMLAIDLPPTIVEVVLAAQNDPAGSPAAQLLERVIERFRSQGRRVRVARAPSGTKDFNDMIRRDQQAAEQLAQGATA